MMKMKTKVIPIVMVTLIGICIFAPIVSAETVKGWNQKGIDFVRSGEYERAIECFDKAIELNPNLATPYSNRGAAYKGLKQYERAIEDYNKAIELNPNYAEAYNNRELARDELKEQKSTPAFESIFAVVGLLAVAYLLRRRK